MEFFEQAAVLRLPAGRVAEKSDGCRDDLCGKNA